MKTRWSYPAVLTGLLAGVAVGLFAGKWFWQSNADKSSLAGQDKYVNLSASTSKVPEEISPSIKINKKKETALRIDTGGHAETEKTKVTDTLNNTAWLPANIEIKTVADSLMEQRSIVIKRNVLIRSVLVAVQEEENETEIDSLTQQVSGVINPKNSGKLLVEFWQSPVNYKGYRMANGKLVIYGIPPQDSILADAISGDTVRLKINSTSYVFHRTLIFEPLIPLAPEAASDTL